MQYSVPRCYTQLSELSPHWQCYLLALRTASDLANALHFRSAERHGEASGRQRGHEEEEAGLSQVFQFVDAFGVAMFEGLSTFPPSPGAGVGVGEARLTLALVQERVDVVGLVSALGPWMPRWRAQHPDASSALLEVSRLACCKERRFYFCPSKCPRLWALECIYRERGGGDGGVRKALTKFDGRYYKINGLVLKLPVGTEQNETVTGGRGGVGGRLSEITKLPRSAADCAFDALKQKNKSRPFLRKISLLPLPPNRPFGRPLGRQPFFWYRPQVQCRAR